MSHIYQIYVVLVIWILPITTIDIYTYTLLSFLYL